MSKQPRRWRTIGNKRALLWLSGAAKARPWDPILEELKAIEGRIEGRLDSIETELGLLRKVQETVIENLGGTGKAINSLPRECRRQEELPFDGSVIATEVGKPTALGQQEISDTVEGTSTPIHSDGGLLQHSQVHTRGQQDVELSWPQHQQGDLLLSRGNEDAEAAPKRRVAVQRRKKTKKHMPSGLTEDCEVVPQQIEKPLLSAELAKPLTGENQSPLENPAFPEPPEEETLWDKQQEQLKQRLQQQHKQQQDWDEDQEAREVVGTLSVHPGQSLAELKASGAAAAAAEAAVAAAQAGVLQQESAEFSRVVGARGSKGEEEGGQAACALRMAPAVASVSPEFEGGFDDVADALEEDLFALPRGEEDGKEDVAECEVETKKDATATEIQIRAQGQETMVCGETRAFELPQSGAAVGLTSPSTGGCHTSVPDQVFSDGSLEEDLGESPMQRVEAAAQAASDQVSSDGFDAVADALEEDLGESPVQPLESAAQAVSDQVSDGFDAVEEALLKDLGESTMQPEEATAPANSARHFSNDFDVVADALVQELGESTMQPEEAAAQAAAQANAPAAAATTAAAVMLPFDAASNGRREDICNELEVSNRQQNDMRCRPKKRRRRETRGLCDDSLAEGQATASTGACKSKEAVAYGISTLSLGCNILDREGVAAKAGDIAKTDDAANSTGNVTEMSTDELRWQWYAAQQKSQQQEQQQQQQQRQEHPEHQREENKFPFQVEDEVPGHGQGQEQDREQPEEQHKEPKHQHGQEQRPQQSQDGHTAVVAVEFAATEANIATSLPVDMSEEEIRWEWYQTGRGQNFEAWSALLSRDHPCRRGFRAQQLMPLPKCVAETVVLDHPESHDKQAEADFSIQPEALQSSKACTTAEVGTESSLPAVGADGSQVAPTMAMSVNKRRKQEWYREKYGGNTSDLRADEPRLSKGRSGAAPGRRRSVSAPPAHATAAQVTFSPLQPPAAQHAKKQGAGVDQEVKLQKLAHCRFADLPRVDDVLPPL